MKPFGKSKRASFRLLCAVLSLCFGTKAFVLAADDALRTTITIENARNTLYEKDGQTGNDCIVLLGDVRVRVSRGSSKSVIRADTIRYDRVTEMMYAEGGVELEQTTASSGGQTVTAGSLMFNTSTLEGIFDDGRVVQTKSDAMNLPTGSTLIVSSDIFGRSESNTIAFKDGILTFCDDENPHWRIKASRIWLLPGGEFAFLNALLFIGALPVAYLPAFYYPKDELVFNPVFGSRPREGYFIQTTTYIYGRKPLEQAQQTSSSDSDGADRFKGMFNFIKPTSLKRQRLEGIVLHNLDEDYTGDTSNYLKVMGDYYSNLGIMAGLDGAFKPNNAVGSLEAGAQIGFSNTVFKKSGGVYVPYDSNGSKIQDASNLLGFELPFRYSGKFKISVARPFSLSLALPIYSDPYFYDDFSRREESMDWIGYMIDAAASDDEDEARNPQSSFTWNLTGSYSAPIPSAVKPYISSASLNVASSVIFSSRSVSREELTNDGTSDSSWKDNTPQKSFYYPSQVVPATVSAAISGTIFQWSSTKARPASASGKEVRYVSALSVPEELRAAEEEPSDSEGAGGKDSFGEDSAHSDGGGSEKDSDSVLPKGALPSLSLPPPPVVMIPGIDLSAAYSIRPSLSTQLVYPSDLKKPDDFEWENLRSSMYTFKIPITLDNSFSYAGSVFSMSNSNAFEPVFQRHPHISTDVEKGGYTESAAASLEKADYAAEKRDLTSTNSVSLKPFHYLRGIKDTGVTWRSTIRMVRTEFLDDEYDATGSPRWEYHAADWSDEDSITVNALDFTLAANQLDSAFSQALTVSVTLPPQAEQYYGTVKFGLPHTTLSFEAGVKKSSTKDDAQWVKQPFKQNFSLSLFNNSLKFSESYNYSLEEERHDAFKASAAWKSLQAAYIMSYTYGYDFDTEKGWVQRAEQDFLPYSLSLSFAPGTKKICTWKNRIDLGLGLSTSVVADLIRPTNSYFTFAPSVSFKINEFLSLTFSASSRNSVIYRYFGNELGINGETDLFKDLLNSFRFDNEELRKNSGFKLKSLNFELSHELHDWDFKTAFKIEPRLKTDVSSGKKPYYDFSPYVRISVVWRPMSAMKTEIIDDYGEWKLVP